MTTDDGKLVWRVRSADGLAHASAFDALIFGDDHDGPIRRSYSARVLAEAVPYQSELPHVALVLVVRAHPDVGPLLVDCEAIGPDGSRRFFARATQPLAVFVCSKTGISVGGLPGLMIENAASP